jgi:hypothetical protein
MFDSGFRATNSEAAKILQSGHPEDKFMAHPFDVVHLWTTNPK